MSTVSNRLLNSAGSQMRLADSLRPRLQLLREFTGRAVRSLVVGLSVLLASYGVGLASGIVFPMVGWLARALSTIGATAGLVLFVLYLGYELADMLKSRRPWRALSSHSQPDGLSQGEFLLEVVFAVFTGATMGIVVLLSFWAMSAAADLALPTVGWVATAVKTIGEIVGMILFVIYCISDIKSLVTGQGGRR